MSLTSLGYCDNQPSNQACCRLSFVTLITISNFRGRPTADDSISLILSLLCPFLLLIRLAVVCRCLSSKCVAVSSCTNDDDDDDDVTYSGTRTQMSSLPHDNYAHSCLIDELAASG